MTQHVHQIGGIAAVEHAEACVEPNGGRMAANQTIGDGVKRARPGDTDRSWFWVRVGRLNRNRNLNWNLNWNRNLEPGTDDALRPPDHFERRAAGKGEQENPFRPGTRQDKMRHPVGQRIRFAGAGTSDDEQRARTEACSFLLFRVQHVVTIQLSPFSSPSKKLAVAFESAVSFSRRSMILTVEKGRLSPALVVLCAVWGSSCVRAVKLPSRNRLLQLISACILCILIPSECLAQLPAGTIVGVVRDAGGGVVTGVHVEATSLSTRQVRAATSGEQGEYSIPALQPGEYEVTAEVPGFQRSVRAATIQAGTSTTVELILLVGDLSDSVTVEAAVPQIRRDSAAVSGVVTFDQIQGLPLNGRNFLELAKLEPGLQSPSTTNRNRTIVPVLSAPAANVGGPRFTIDGGSVTSIALGGAQMTFSQELVQEFQVSSVNYDLAAGMTDAGSINVITRSGGNEPHGTVVYFFRDHNLSAYPGLTRDRTNPDPFFQRQQYGVALGGPVHRDRLFYFGSWERNDQRGVAATAVLTPEFAHLSRITSSPLVGALFSGRLDARINGAHTVFARYSRDASDAFGPSATSTGGSPNAYPSNWNAIHTRADQSAAGVTSVIGSTLVNDLRFSLFGITSSLGAPGEPECHECLGLGSPSITVAQAGLVIGHSVATDFRGRRVHFNDSFTWKAGAHRMRVGVDWEHNRERNLIWGNEPVTMTVYSPARVRAHNSTPGILPEERIPLPADFGTVADILQLPLQSMTVGIGQAGVPQENGGIARRWNTLWLYAEDAWRAHERVTLTYGLGWALDGNLNHDLSKPPLLEPILGTDGLRPTQKTWTNFSPSLGVVWTTASDGKTVVRASAGRYYRPHGLTSSMDAERIALGPPGLRQNFSGSSIANPLSGVPGIPAGTPLEFRSSPTRFTGADLMASLPAIRSRLAASLANQDPALQQIQITKQASPAIFPVDVPNPSAVHVNVGLQREVAHSLVVSADAVYRHFLHVPQNGGAIDVNHFSAARGPVIPECTPVQVDDPRAVCSRGAINVQVVPYTFTYRGLLVRAEKRYSGGLQFLGSYAYSRSSATHAGIGFNLDNWLENTGPAGPTHIFNAAGSAELPSRVEVGVNFAFSSAVPFSAFVGGIDFNGDGTQDDLLPGTTVNAFNRTMERADLERLVAEFNQIYAGTRVARNALVPRVTLPPQFSFGDNVHTLDIRLSRSFMPRRGLRLTLIGEAFNVYNAANLAGHSEDLTSSAFGQPTSRATQIFGSGGPRAVQLAIRVSF
jgi:hypothetical protein